MANKIEILFSIMYHSTITKMDTRYYNMVLPDAIPCGASSALTIECKPVDVGLELEPEPEECGICLETTERNDLGTFACRHSFCYKCIGKIMASSRRKCALCRTVVSIIYVEQETVKEALTDLLKKNKSKQSNLPPDFDFIPF